MSHSVQNHLGMKPSDYDRIIRTFIPGYDAMLDTMAWWLNAIVPADAEIVEMGGGTGRLAYALASKLPKIRIEVWDVDTKIQKVAAERLAPYADRVKARERSFTEPIQPCDAVVANLALHHLREPAAKEAVYANIYKALRGPGIFLCGDPLIPLEPAARDAAFRAWTEFMGTHGIPADEARAHFADWANEDRYFSMGEELGFLTRAGFREPQIFWRQGPMAVYGGIKG
jgi:tRNA (cmo5U34)-methyltransferase